MAIKRLTATRALALCLSVTFTLAAAGCGSSKGKEEKLAPGAPVKVGYLASLTGFCASFSQDYVKGAQQAVKTINAQGGVLGGHPLQLIVRDDKADPSTGVSQARDLVLASHVKFLAGTCTSAVGKSVTQLVANPSHIVYAVGVADPTVFSAKGYSFDTIPTAATEGANAAAFVRAHPQWKRVAVISEDYSYGYEVTGAFMKAMKGSSQQIVSKEYVPSGASSYSSFISKLIAEKPDVVYSTVIAEDTITFVKQAFPLGFFKATKLFGILDYGTIDPMPKPPVGALGYTYYPSASIYKTPLSAKLAPLGTETANSGAAGDGFNQIEVIAQGIQKAKSVDPVKVREALEDATVEVVQGKEKIHACNHLMAVPIAMGPVVAANKEQPFAHFSPIELVDTNKYFTC